MNKTLYIKPDVLIVDMQVQEMIASTTIQTDPNENPGRVKQYGFYEEYFNSVPGGGNDSWTEANSDDYNFTNF